MVDGIELGSWHCLDFTRERKAEPCQHLHGIFADRNYSTSAPAEIVASKGSSRGIGAICARLEEELLEFGVYFHVFFLMVVRMEVHGLDQKFIIFYGC